MRRSNLIDDLAKSQVCPDQREDFVDFVEGHDTAESFGTFSRHLDAGCEKCGDAVDIVFDFDARALQALARRVREFGLTPHGRNCQQGTKVVLWGLIVIFVLLVFFAILLTRSS